MKRLEKNKGSYHGETIDVGRIQREIRIAAQAFGWVEDCFLQADDLALSAYRRAAGSGQGKRLYLSAGIHGDEPAGPLAVLDLLQRNWWPDDVGVWLVPCLNPTGFQLNRRENSSGIDLNRDYRNPVSREVQSHLRWIGQQPSFDLALILHEDWEANGYYVYEVNPDERVSPAESILKNVAQVCPIEFAETVDNWEARGGIIRPKLLPGDRPKWPEAVYLITTKTRHSFTLEAPSDFPLDVRVRAHVTAVDTVLQSLHSA